MQIILLAKFDPFERAESYAKATRAFFADASVVLIVGAVVLTVFVVWAKYLRNRRKRVSGGEKVFRSSASAAYDDAEAGESRRRYKRRVRRREHRGRNPTIAETGGLPPLRSEQGSNPSSPHAS